MMKTEKIETKNTPFVECCKGLAVNHGLFFSTLTHYELFNLKYPIECDNDSKWMFLWHDFVVMAKLKDDTAVRVWIVSRMGDVGITENIENANGYDKRIDIEELHDFTINRIKKTF